MNQSGKNTIHQHCSRTTKCRLRSHGAQQKDIEIQHSLEVVEHEGENGQPNDLHHAVADVLWIRDEVLVRLHLSALSVEQLVHGTQVERERTDARDHHENANDHVPDRRGGNRAQDVAGHTVVGLVERKEDNSNGDVDKAHHHHGHGDGASDALVVRLLHVLLRITSSR